MKRRNSYLLKDKINMINYNFKELGSMKSTRSSSEGNSGTRGSTGDQPVPPEEGTRSAGEENTNGGEVEWWVVVFVYDLNNRLVSQRLNGDQYLDKIRASSLHEDYNKIEPGKLDTSGKIWMKIKRRGDVQLRIDWSDNRNTSYIERTITDREIVKEFVCIRLKENDQLEYIPWPNRPFYWITAFVYDHNGYILSRSQYVQKLSCWEYGVANRSNAGLDNNGKIWNKIIPAEEVRLKAAWSDRSSNSEIIKNFITTGRNQIWYIQVNEDRTLTELNQPPEPHEEQEEQEEPEHRDYWITARVIYRDYYSWGSTANLVPWRIKVEIIDGFPGWEGGRQGPWERRNQIGGRYNGAPWYDQWVTIRVRDTVKLRLTDDNGYEAERTFTPPSSGDYHGWRVKWGEAPDEWPWEA